MLTNRIENLAKTSGKYNKKLTMTIVIFSALGGMMYGYDIGVISGALLFLNKTIELSNAQMGLVVGAVLWGGAIAIFIAGPLGDIWGRKRIIIIGQIFFIIGVIITVLCNDFTTLIAGRLVQGIGIGVVSMLIPLYITETAPASVRGRSVTMFQLFLVLGISIAAFVDLAFVATQNWRAMFGMVLIPGVIFFFGMFYLPESPAWFFLKNKVKESRKILLKLYDAADTNIILEQMETLKKRREADKAKGMEAKKETIFKRVYMVPFAIALFIAIIQQFTGVNLVLQYAPVIFKNAGIESDTMDMLATTGITILNVVFTIVGVMLVDKIGRKALLSIGTAGVFVGMILCAISYSLGSGQIVVLGFGLAIFMSFFAIGPGIVVWLAMSELLPLRIRGVGMAICLGSNSIASAYLASVYLSWTDAIGFSGVFWVLAICSVAYFICAKYILPETKGKTLEEIEEHFRGKYEKA
jgi:sugar porter (SP) family MFS transporter